MSAAEKPVLGRKEEKKIPEKDIGGRRVLKTGMIAKKPMQDISKGVRQDIDDEDHEESYYR